MNIYFGSPLVWVLSLLGLAAFIYSLRAFIGYRAVTTDSLAEYEYRKSKGMVPDALSRDGFLRAYRRTNNPRYLLFTAMALIAILALTPIIFILLERILQFFYDSSGQSRVIEPGYLVWQFLIFVATMGSWAGIGWTSARFYHGNAPGNFEMEVAKELERQDR